MDNRHLRTSVNKAIVSIKFQDTKRLDACPYSLMLPGLYFQINHGRVTSCDNDELCMNILLMIIKVNSQGYTLLVLNEIKCLQVLVKSVHVHGKR